MPRAPSPDPATAATLVVAHHVRSNVIAAWLPQETPSAAAFPLVSTPAAAGYPSPAGDYIEGSLDLNEYLVRNKSATFFVEFGGDSLVDLGILDRDKGGCDRSVPASIGRVVIATVDGEIVGKVLDNINGRLALVSRNEQQNYPPIFLDRCQDYQLWGCITSVVRKL